MSNEFNGRVVLITGGSRGIGRATALRLAREGADIALSYATRAADAEETANAIHALGRRAIYRQCNVANSDDVNRLVDAARQLGPIDYLVHSGAISNIQDHSTLTLELWREMIDVNLTGTYLAVFAVKDDMIKRRFGRIVTISSVAALRPRKMQIHYASAKAGVIAFTRCCAEAFAPYNVRINGVAPGLIETEMVHVLSDETIKGVVEQTPMGRMGTAEEVAAAIRFLLSDESSFMVGNTIDVSGGRITLP
jgi:3-oxoacyl-[acyl-carrier protein] reductase